MAARCATGSWAHRGNERGSWQHIALDCGVHMHLHPWKSGGFEIFATMPLLHEKLALQQASSVVYVSKQLISHAPAEGPSIYSARRCRLPMWFRNTTTEHVGARLRFWLLLWIRLWLGLGLSTRLYTSRFRLPVALRLIPWASTPRADGLSAAVLPWVALFTRRPICGALLARITVCTHCLLVGRVLPVWTLRAVGCQRAETPRRANPTIWKH
eukprot:COSAG06_NODE_20052_length_811_cov_0.998596_1_plen_212_part_10